MLAIGLLIFVAGVWRGRDHDRRILVGCAAVMGVVAAIGGSIELAGVASILDIGWVDALGDDLGSSAMMRLIGGGLIALGLVESLRPDPAGSTWRLAPSAFFAFGGAVSFCITVDSCSEILLSSALIAFSIVNVRFLSQVTVPSSA